MRRWLPACLTCGLIGVACDSAGDSVPHLEIRNESKVVPRLAISIFASEGSLVTDRVVDDGGAELEFPLRVDIDPSGRQGDVRVMVWGQDADGADVSFGATSLDLGAADAAQVLLSDFPADCDGDRIPDSEDRCPGVPDFSQLDSDGEAPSDACTPGLACAENLAVNGDFEMGTGGWRASGNSTSSHVEGGHDSGFAMRTCKEPGAGIPESYDVDDKDAIMSTIAGVTYRLSGWVRTDTAEAQQLDAGIFEDDAAGNDVGNDPEDTLTPTSDWQLLSTSYTTMQDESSLKIQFKSVEAADTELCFDLDDVCLTRIYPECL